MCCVAPSFTASADFAITKPAGHACPNLQTEGFGCGIHLELRERGFAGCTVFDCFGAGQKVAQVTFAGRDWRQAPETAAAMFDVFAVMRQLHELLWYLTEALTLASARSLYSQLRPALERTEELTRADRDTLIGFDIAAHRQRLNELLLLVSALARAPYPQRLEHRGADLVGADLRGVDLTGASFRGALLIGADLRGRDLTATDVTGADLRVTDLRGADLSAALFLTQFQVNAANGDAATKLPAVLVRPSHWGSPAHS